MNAIEKINTWKLVCFVLIPIACVYQLLWNYYFQSVQPDFWQTQNAEYVLEFKIISEVFIYTVMLWLLATKTASKVSGGKYGACILLFGIILYSLYSLHNI